MVPDAVVIAADFCQSLIPLISLTAYLPQWRKILATRSSSGVSLRSWCIWTMSSSLAVFYAIVQFAVTGRGWALIASSAVTLLFVVVTVFLVVHFHPRRRSARLPVRA